MKPIKPTDATLVCLRAYDPEGKMHPDGLPWQKQCRGVSMRYHGTMNCAFIDGRLPDDELFPSADPFPCWHRKDAGFYRVCAGWAKHHRKTK
jgi:hypothetical protein